MLDTFQCIDLDIAQCNASAGDKFVFEPVFAVDVKMMIGECLCQAVEPLSAHFCPSHIPSQFTFVEQMHPQRIGEVCRVDVLQLFLWIIHGHFVQFGGHLFSIAPTTPVDGDVGLIVVFVQVLCTVGREFEYGRSAESPMCDEQRSRSPHLGAGNACAHLVDHGAHQVSDGVLRQAEAEKRCHGCDDVEVQVGQHLQGFAAAATCGDEHQGGHGGVRIVEVQQVVLSHVFDVAQPVSRFHLHLQFGHALLQRVHNLHGILRGRKHTLVVLGDQRHPSLFEPLACGMVVKLSHQSFHQSCAARIGRFHALHLVERVGQVAASSTGDGHLGQEPAATFIDGDIRRGAKRFDMYGGETSRRPSADDGNVFVGHMICKMWLMNAGAMKGGNCRHRQSPPPLFFLIRHEFG